MCWLPSVVLKVKWSLALIANEKCFPDFPPPPPTHTPSISDYELCRLVILKCQRNQTHTKKAGNRAKTGGFVVPEDTAGVQPRSTVQYLFLSFAGSTTPFCQKQKLKGLLGNNFSESWSHWMLGLGQFCPFFLAFSLPWAVQAKRKTLLMFLFVEEFCSSSASPRNPFLPAHTWSAVWYWAINLAHL